MARQTIDRVLFLGGDDLTLFQSVGLVCVGLAVLLFVVFPITIYEFQLASEYRGLAGPYIAVAMSLWALAMIFNGAVGIQRNFSKSKKLREENSHKN
jgi:hypothetical protein